MINVGRQCIDCFQVSFDNWNQGCHLAALVVHPDGKARRRQQEQRLLFGQLLPETVDDLWTLVASLKSHRSNCLTAWLDFMRYVHQLTDYFLSFWTDLCKASVRPHYLLSLNLTAEVWDLDLYGVELFVGDLGDGEGLGLLGALEGQLSQGNVPLTVILLVFTAVRGGEGMDVKEEWIDKDGDEW